MNIALKRNLPSDMRQIYGHFLHDHMRRSSTFLLGSSLVGSIFGFSFWLLCAHLTSSAQLGFAASLLAYVNLYSTITTLGLGNAVIRFLPKHSNKDSYFGTVLAITANASILLGAALLFMIRFLSPKLIFAVTNPEIFALLLIILVTSSISTITDSALLAQRSAKNIFIKAVWQSPLKILLPFVFFHLNLKGILIITAISTSIGALYELIILYRHNHKRFAVDTLSLEGTYKFTAGNFMGTIFGIFPATLVPIIVLNQLGASLAAYFYIALQFASILSLISSSSAQAYLSEASNDTETHYMSHLLKALKNLYSLLLPTALLMAIIGTQMLKFYGHAYYTHASVLLLLLCVASLFVGINWLGDSLLNVQKRPFAYGVMNFINALLVVVLVRFEASKGLTAVGAAWLAAQALTVLIYIVLQSSNIREYISTNLLGRHKQRLSAPQSYPMTDYHYMPSQLHLDDAIHSYEWLLVIGYFRGPYYQLYYKNSRRPEVNHAGLQAEAQQSVSQTPLQA
jgi:O-antigen/teichoic acid export membrane protein